MEYKEIDLTPVKRKIIEQAFASAHTMTEEQKQKLINDKFDRALKLRQALKRELNWHTDR